MAIYGLIAAHQASADSNPGCRLITDGIRWLLRQVDPEALFLPIGMMHEDPAGWELAFDQADVLLLCGNPRFNLDERRVYWDWDIWRRILQAHDAGIPFIDAWAGAAHPMPLEDAQAMAQSIATLTKTQQILSHESRALLCISRDAVAHQLLHRANPHSVLLPCSTWYAAAEHQVVSADKDRHCITLREMPGNAWIIDRALEWQRQLERELPTYLVVHSLRDYRWVRRRRAVRKLLCICEEASLLRFYARVDKLVSLRLHASVPALSLGARVCDLALDSRSLTLEQFGVRSIPFTANRVARRASEGRDEAVADPDHPLPFQHCPSPPQPEAAVRALTKALARAGVTHVSA